MPETSLDIGALQTLSENFHSIDDGIYEAIQNCIQAKSKTIRISLSRFSEEHLITIIDDGVGISKERFENNYCRFGTRSANGQSRNKGTGRVGYLKYSRLVRVETNPVDEEPYAFELRWSELVKGPIEVVTRPGPSMPKGTRIHLHDPERMPQKQGIKKFLHKYFSGEPISFYVGGELFNPAELGRPLYSKDVEVPGVGVVRGRLWHSKENVESGTAVSINRQRTPIIPQLMAREKNRHLNPIIKKITGSFDVTSPLEASMFDAPGDHRQALQDHVDEVLTRAASDVAAKEDEESVRSLVVLPEIQAIYRRLPAARQRMFERFVASHLRSPAQELHQLLAKTVVRALAEDDVVTVLRALEEADVSDMGELAAVLSGQDKWTIRKVAFAAQMLKHRLHQIDELERIVHDQSNAEDVVHAHLVDNPWILADDFTHMVSNKELTTILKQVVSDNYRIANSGRDARRPDIVFALADCVGSALDSRRRLLVVELKHPGKALSNIDLSQVAGYADALKERGAYSSADAILIGHELSQIAKPKSSTNDSGVRSYAITFEHLIATARAKYKFMLDAQRDDEDNLKALANDILMKQQGLKDADPA